MLSVATGVSVPVTELAWVYKRTSVELVLLFTVKVTTPLPQRAMFEEVGALGAVVITSGVAVRGLSQPVNRLN